MFAVHAGQWNGTTTHSPVMADPLGPPPGSMSGYTLYSIYCDSSEEQLLPHVGAGSGAIARRTLLVTPIAVRVLVAIRACGGSTAAPPDASLPLASPLQYAGGLGVRGARSLAASRGAARVRTLGGRGFRLHFDRQLHRFGRLGGRSHWQVNTWRHGVRGSGRPLRFPVWRSF